MQRQVYNQESSDLNDSAKPAWLPEYNGGSIMVSKFNICEVVVGQDGKSKETVVAVMKGSRGKAQARADRLNDKETMVPPTGPIKGYIIRSA